MKLAMNVLTMTDQNHHITSRNESNTYCSLWLTALHVSAKVGVELNIEHRADMEGTLPVNGLATCSRTSR